MNNINDRDLYRASLEWCHRLVAVLQPLVIEGLRSIFEEAWLMCVETKETDKYLMTFQNLLSRVPRWSAILVEEERKRMIERSGCTYMEDLITCVHIIQLKDLTSINVGSRHKKVDIAIPKLDMFIHKVYIHAARKAYCNTYLFDRTASPLDVQRNNRELEILVENAIMSTIREGIPTEDILRAYLEESVEEEQEVVLNTVEGPAQPLTTVVVEEAPPSVGVTDITEQPVVTHVTFADEVTSSFSPPLFPPTSSTPSPSPSPSLLSVAEKEISSQGLEVVDLNSLSVEDSIVSDEGLKLDFIEL